MNEPSLMATTRKVLEQVYDTLYQQWENSDLETSFPDFDNFLRMVQDANDNNKVLGYDSETGHFFLENSFYNPYPDIPKEFGEEE